MLGGETIYDDYAQEMPYARLDDSVTAYAVAQSEDAWLQELDNEDLPAIIWRYAPDVGKVYVVNGDYLTGQMGAGLLTGFAADTESVYLYPVVNAQVSVVENYPTLADENKDYMEREYGSELFDCLPRHPLAFHRGYLLRYRRCHDGNRSFSFGL